MDGICPHGCDAGMYGDKCDLGNMKIPFSFNIFYIKFVIFKSFSTENLNCNLYNASTLKYRLDNMVLDETLSREVVTVRGLTKLYVICCFVAHISRPVIDYHEKEKSYQTGDLFLEFLSLVSWIASIKVIVLKLFVMKIAKLRLLSRKYCV